MPHSSFKKLNLTVPLVVLDLETTGLNIVHDRIVEMAMMKLIPDARPKTLYTKINPERPIPIEATRVHGIEQKDVENEPTFRQVAERLHRFLDGADLAGFNILNFDLPMLVESFLRCGIRWEPSHETRIVDAQKIFHLMEKRTLKAAYRFYCCGEGDLENAHHAVADVKATVRVLMRQVERYEGRTVEDGLGNVLGVVKNDVAVLHDLTIGKEKKRVDWSGKFVYDERRRPVFNFGKHKGETCERVWMVDPSYFTWMMRQDFSLDTRWKVKKMIDSFETFYS